MTEPGNLARRIAGLSPQQRERLRARLTTSDEPKAPAGEPIAVIGLGCRFPGGADSPSRFWRMLMDGVDAVTETPSDRWDADAFFDPDVAAPGTMNTRWGGFIHPIDQFDAPFFGISPREAAQMDPQQRLLLEVCWEAMEDAGQTVGDPPGSRTGVFLGIHSHSSDYHVLQLSHPERVSTYTGSGTAHSIAANRLSYCFDLRGPSLTIDTACSSSLVAVHLACESLRRGESTRAVAGGSNLMLSPEVTIACSKMRMMSPDGRCKTFDRSANGFVRGEGVGLVVLKRLSEAVADNDDILAVIAGSAVNQDGRTNGLTAPNGLSQASVIRAALEMAGVDGSDVSYVEAHGTGTSLGDPIEVEALASVLAPGRDPDRRCVLGSVKTNVGHLEGAAGIAGLLKTVLALRNGRIPPHLHFKEPNPLLDLESTPFDIVPAGCDWPRTNRRIAGVSSFGFGGTNAHVILTEAPTREVEPRAEDVGGLLPISARDPGALRDLAHAFRVRLAEQPDSAAVCAAAGVRRTHHEHRLAVLGGSSEELQGRLDDYAAEESSPFLHVRLSAPDRSAAGVVLVFSGQGSQWPEMGRELIGTEPVFRDAIAACDEHTRVHAGWSLLERVFRSSPSNDVYETEVAQPAIFAVQVALTALWESWGLRPDAVLGHSLGEVAAAHACGALTLEDGVRIVCARGRAMAEAEGLGRMVAVEMTAADAQALVVGRNDVWVSAVNGPNATVLGGEPSAIADLHAQLTQGEVPARMIRVDLASHTPIMRPAARALTEALAPIRPARARVPIVSAVTGLPIAGEDLGPEYWGRNLTDPVQFHSAVQHLIGTGHRAFVELSAHPVLAASVSDCLDHAGVDGVSVGCLRRERPERLTMLSAVGRMYVEGWDLDWHALHGDRVPPAGLPGYPWRHARYWLDDPVDRGEHGRPDKEAGTPPVPEPSESTIRRRPDAAMPTFEARIVFADDGRPTHHRGDAEVVPATQLLELVQRVAMEALELEAPIRSDPALQLVFDELVFENALTLTEGEAWIVQIALVPGGNGDADFRVFGRRARSPEAGADWTRLMVGRIGSRASVRERPDPSHNGTGWLEARKARCPALITGADYYDGLRASGFTFPSSARVLRAVWSGEGEAFGALAVANPGAADPGTMSHLVFGGLQLVRAALGPASPGTTLAPTSVDSLAISGPQGLHGSRIDEAFAHLRVVCDARPDGGDVAIDLDVLDPEGRPLAEVRGMTVAEVPLDPAAVNEARLDWQYEVEWKPQALDLNEVLPDLEDLATAYVSAALAGLGCNLIPGMVLDPADLAEELGVVERHRELFARMLDTLVEDGILARTGNGIEVVRAPLPTDPSNRVRALTADYGEFGPEIELLARCGSHLAAVLTGVVDPLDLLFPDGSMTELQRIYGESPQFGADSARLGQRVAELVAATEKDGPVRILEIGAGTGGTTRNVLTRLPADGIEYVFTDVSEQFLTASRRRNPEDTRLQYALFDVERPASSQGLPTGDFDIVIAANVLHATADLAASLRNASELLAPGGCLVLLEMTRRLRWIDLTFGTTDGWWRSADHDLRPDHPLLPGLRWAQLMAEVGFEDTDPSTASAGALQSLIVGRRPGGSRKLTTRSPVLPWLVLADDGGVGEGLRKELEARGCVARLVRPGPDTGIQSDGSFTVNPQQDGGMRDMIRWAAGEQESIAGVIDLWPLDAEKTSVEQAVPGAGGAGGCGTLVRLTRALCDVADGEPKLWLVTRGAQGPGTRTRQTLTQAGVWGLGRGIALEHPDLWGGCVDLDPTESVEVSARMLAAEVLGPGVENQIDLRAGRRYVARLVRRQPDDVALEPLRLHRNATYLITGGLGVLGLRTAEWLAEQGAGHLVLTSRTGLPDRASWPDIDPTTRAARQIASIETIESKGARVTPLSVDAGSPEDVALLFDRLSGDPPLRGIVHAAGLAEPRPLAEMTDQDLADTFHPKVLGAWALHERTQDLSLDFFLLYSSSTALLGATQLAHYAAANCYLDALAGLRVSEGLPGSSINWGLWEGYRGLREEERAAGLRHGLLPMDSREALSTLGSVMSRPTAGCMVASVDWTVLRPAYEARGPQPFLSELGLAGGVAESPSSHADGPPPLAEELANTPAGDRLYLLEEHVSAAVARVLGLETGREIDPEKGLFDMGMDSLTSVELRNRLERSTGESLPATLTFNHPTIRALATYLNRILASSIPGAEQPDDTSAPASPHDEMSESELARELATRLDRLS